MILEVLSVGGVLCDASVGMSEEYCDLKTGQEHTWSAHVNHSLLKSSSVSLLQSNLQPDGLII